jgi:hypothetical protein
MTIAPQRRSQSAPGREAPSASVPVEEFEVLRTWHPNLLLCGPPEATTAALEALRGVFQPVIVNWAGSTALPLPPGSGVRTLILHDVESLSPEDQQQLLAWLKTNFGSVQVVATTARPLLELVESAKFDPALYYALNVVYIKLPSWGIAS